MEIRKWVADQSEGWGLGFGPGGSEGRCLLWRTNHTIAPGADTEGSNPGRNIFLGGGLEVGTG